jgi:hypothetical protein
MGGERRETRPAAVMAQDAMTYSEVLLGDVLTVNSNAKWHGDVCGSKLW